MWGGGHHLIVWGFLNCTEHLFCRVAFGPSAVAIDGNRPVREGQKINLICNAVGTNPASVIQWIPPDYVNLPEHARCPIGNICNHVAGRLEVSDKPFCNICNHVPVHVAGRLEVSEMPYWHHLQTCGRTTRGKRILPLLLQPFFSNLA